jgi:glyoxylase-like metal-dependent hydrolase (beta-lactamase superfamily II)
VTDALPIVLGDNVIYALPLAGGGVLLVDAGPDFDLPDGEPTWDAALTQARAHGFAPADVRAVVVTHAHIDHAGLAARWADAGARILAGAADVPAVAAGRASNEAQREPRFAELRRHGCPEDLLRRLAALRGGRRLRWEPCPREAIEPIAGDAAVPLAPDLALAVLDLPGHTPGNLVAHLARRGDLFSGDTLLPTTIPTAGLHFPGAIPGAPGEGDPDARWPSLPPFLRAVERLRALHVRRVFPGHGGIVDDPEPLFARFEAHHARRATRIRALLAAEPATAYELARGLFPRLPAERIGQAVTEVIGHLDLLVEQQQAEPVDAGAGVRRYRLREDVEEAR